MTRIVIGVKPGPYHTGIVVRQGSLLRHWSLITRSLPFDWYLHDVCDNTVQAKDAARLIALESSPNHLGEPAILAVADAVTDAAQDADYTELLETAQVLGAIAGHWLITRIPPADIHRKPLSDYPTRLTDPGLTRHLRGAWDVADAALQLLRQAEATA